MTNLSQSTTLSIADALNFHRRAADALGGRLGPEQLDGIACVYCNRRGRGDMTPIAKSPSGQLFLHVYECDRPPTREDVGAAFEEAG